jgi:hypothetical protein
MPDDPPSFMPADKVLLIEDPNLDKRDDGATLPFYALASDADRLTPLCANFAYGPDSTACPVLYALVRFWDSSGGGPPAWPADTDARRMTDLFLDDYLSVASVNGSSNTQMKYSWRWPVPENITSWKFIHYRWRESAFDPDHPDDPPVDLSSTQVLTWKGEAAPGGYNRFDPLTWPASDWIEATMPSPSPGQTLYNRIRMIFPGEGWMQIWRATAQNNDITGVTEGVRQYHGLVPGGRTNYSDRALPVFANGRRFDF